MNDPNAQLVSRKKTAAWTEALASLSEKEARKIQQDGDRGLVRFGRYVAARNSPAFARFQSRIYNLPSYSPPMPSFLNWLASSWNSALGIEEEVVHLGPGGPRDEDATRACRGAVVDALAEFDFPFYLISPSLAEAINHTDPPDGCSREDLRMGFPAMCFFLPPDTLSTPSGEDVRYLIVMDMSIPGLSNAKDFVLMVGFSIFGQDGTGEDFVGFCHKDHLNDREDEGEEWHAAFILVFKILNFLNHRGCQDEGGFVKKAKAKRGESPREVWEPRILGANYVMKRSSHRGDGDGTGKGVKLHVRRGHYREQPYGEGRLKRRRVWIEPMWVGGDKE